MRACYTCKKAKPLDAFKKNNALPTGRGYQCKECSARKSREYCRTHRKEKNEYQRIRYLNNSEQIKKSKSLDRLKVKEEVLRHYGGGVPKCSCCKIVGSVFLNVDHIDGGGTQHVKNLGLKGGTDFYRWLRKSGYPGGYQVLCFNCNFAKHILGSCPCATLRVESEETRRTSGSQLLSYQ